MFKQELIKDIKQNGSLPLETFMQRAVMAYYEDNAVFGKEGDFVTAPEISQLFGEVLGAWVADCWVRMGAPKKWHLIEVGPGRGTLMADMLRMITKLPPCAAGMSVYLIDQSNSLKERQQDALKDYQDVSVSWASKIEDIEEKTPFILIGNELLDALPIQQYLVKNKKIYKRYVTYDEQAKQLVYEDREEVNFVIPLALEENGIFEHSQPRINFIKDITMQMREKKGISLLIDYGHAKTAYGDTLQAVKDHDYVNILGDHVGQADLTSHVDFDALKSAVHETMHIEKITSQGAFLTQLGLVLRAQKIGAPMEDVARLVDRDQMGHLFKVFCFADRNYNLQGFA